MREEEEEGMLTVVVVVGEEGGGENELETGVVGGGEWTGIDIPRRGCWRSMN
jgi:hypothetical protein